MLSIFLVDACHWTQCFQSEPSTDRVISPPALTYHFLSNTMFWSSLFMNCTKFSWACPVPSWVFPVWGFSDGSYGSKPGSCLGKPCGTEACKVSDTHATEQELCPIPSKGYGKPPKPPQSGSLLDFREQKVNPENWQHCCVLQKFQLWTRGRLDIWGVISLSVLRVIANSTKQKCISPSSEGDLFWNGRYSNSVLF